MLDFKENVTVLLTKLQFDLKQTRSCEGSNNFIDDVRGLSKNFYDYFNCSSRRFVLRSLVDIQAEIELSERNLKDFESLSKNLFIVIFTLRALGIEIEKMKTSLELLYKQIYSFWETVKGIQNQNIKLIKILADIWKVLKNIKQHLYVLNRHQKDFIENNLELGVVSFADYIQCTTNDELNSILKSLGDASMYFSETVRQVKYLNYLLFNHQKLKSIHTLFSFQILVMINNPNQQSNSVVNNAKFFMHNWLTKCGCGSKPVSKEEVSYIPETILNGIEKQTLEIGTVIHQTVQEVKEVHCASLRREEIVLTDIQAKKIVMLRGLSELQNIITTFAEMENHNDTLVGKTVKTRPLFKIINEFIKLEMSKLEEIDDDDIGKLFK